MSEEGKEATADTSVEGSVQEEDVEEIEEAELELDTVTEEVPVASGSHGKTLEMTESVKEILKDEMPPLEDEVIPRITADTEDILLKTALQAVRQNFTEAKVLSEIRKMYDKYQESQIQNELLSKQCSRFLEKIEAYDHRHRTDPRVMNVLKLAQRHRTHAKAVDEEVTELENELSEAREELKHQEELLRAKSKEISKLMEELRKLKDIERHAESLENQLMLKSGEIQSLRDQHAMEVKALNTQRLNEVAELHAKHAEEKLNESAVVFSTSKSDFSHQEKIALMKDLREKQRYLKLADDDRKMLRNMLQICQDRRHNLTHQLNSLSNINKKLRKSQTQAAYAKDNLLNKYQNLKQELQNTKAKLQGSQDKIDALNTSEKQLHREILHVKSELKGVKEELELVQNNMTQCSVTASNMRRDMDTKEHEIVTLKHNLINQQVQNDSLYIKIAELERRRARQADLFRLSEAHALVLGKELTNLNAECQRQKKAMAECKDEKQKLHSRMCTISNYYVEVAEKNRMLAREKEIQEVYTENAEQERNEAIEKMQTLIKTNIELYSETTTQQEIAMLQNYQFKTKEQEIKALLNSQDDSHSKIASLEQYTRSMAAQIDELNENVMELHQEIAEQHNKIIYLEMDNRSLGAAIMKSEEKAKKYATDVNLFCSQRDVLGAKLIQSQNELLLVEKKLKLSEQVLKNSTVTYENLKNDVRVLKLEIRNLRRKLKCHDGSNNLISVLRQELSKCAKSLELEKARNCALASTRNPKIHRWRALLAADPSKFELYLKIHHLTRCLIAKTTEVVAKEQMITKKDLNYMELRTLVERRTTPAISTEMSIAKATIRKQNRQLQAVTAELNMSYDDVARQEIEAKKKQTKIDEITKKVNKQQQRKRRLLKQCQNKLPPILPNKAGPHFVGGGFLCQPEMKDESKTVTTGTSTNVGFLENLVILKGTSDNTF